MKTKTLKTILALCLTPTLLFGADEQKADKKAAAKTPETHTEIGEELNKIMMDMTNGMAVVKSEASARNFSKVMNALPARLKPLVEKATTLPAPTEKELAAVQKSKDDAEAQMQKSMGEFMAFMMENPDVAATVGPIIQEIMGGIDQEMSEMTDKLDKIYKTEKKANSSEKAPEKKEDSPEPKKKAS